MTLLMRILWAEVDFLYLSDSDLQALTSSYCYYVPTPESILFLIQTHCIFIILLRRLWLAYHWKRQVFNKRHEKYKNEQILLVLFHCELKAHLSHTDGGDWIKWF